MDNQATVMIADNTEEFCSSLVTALQRSEGFRVVGTANDGEQAVRMILEKQPQILVLDLMLAKKDGLGVMKAISTMTGTPTMNHHLILPEYRHMHKEPTPAMTRIATKGEAVSVRMKSRIAMPMMKMNHPDRPSRYSMNMNPT